MGELYLVTGSAGHLGGTVVRALRAEGKRVRALVLPAEKNLPPDTEIFYGDICDAESVRPFFENAEGERLIVIHCAGIVSIASSYQQSVYDINVGGTKNIINLCRQYKAARLIYVSSVHAIPEKPRGQVITEITEFDPDKVIGNYAKSKAMATAAVLQAAKEGLDVCVVHPSGISGPYDYGHGHTTALVIDYCKGRLTSGIGGGYDFVDVRDVARGIVSACKKGRSGECYILSNRYYTVRELLFTLHRVTGKREIKNYLPLWFIKFTAGLAETYYKIMRRPPLFTSYSIYTLNSNALFSHKKADTELGYTARNLSETLSDTVKWLKETGRI